MIKVFILTMMLSCAVWSPSALCADVEQSSTAEFVQVEYINGESEKYELDPNLIMAVIDVESEWDESADNGISIGLMQLNRNTYPWLADQVAIESPEPLNWRQNVRMGTWYIDYLRDKAIEEGYTDEEALYATLIYYNRGVTGGRRWIASHDMYDNAYANKVIAEKARIEQQ